MSHIAIELYKRGMVKIGRFKLSSGLESPFYIDLRRLYSYPDLVEVVVEEVSRRINIDDYDAIVGIATSGLALASFIACRYRKPLAYVRIERKEHGTQSLVEGDVESKCVVIVDDVATTGKSIEHAYRALVNAKAYPRAAFVVVDREQGAKELLSSYGLKLHYIMTARELFQVLKDSGYIDEETYKAIMDYIASTRVQ